MKLVEQIHEYGRRARAAARLLRQLDADRKNAGLLAMADELVAAEAEILSANAQDVEKAKAAGLGPAMLDRLALDP